MSKERMLAFSDGFLAIIITIMVLELRPPHEATFEALGETYPAFLSYLLSFIYLAIYWNNHHHMMVLAKRVNGAILWANMNLLFWLSLVPFATAWLGDTHGASVPTMIYGAVLLMPAIAYFILQGAIIREEGEDSLLKQAVGRDWKGRLSPVAYLSAIALAMVDPRISQAIYVAVALAWLAPDRRVERVLPLKAE